jgi:endonuclease/exonuclease/phosphatase family metal-dependent hydrolase
LRAGGAVVGFLFLVFIGYRGLFVYTFDPSGCGPLPLAAPEAAAPGPDIATPGPRRLRVLTYNMSGHTALLDGGHVAAVARLIGELEPDVVGLQEVHRGTLQARFHDQAGELAARTGLDLFFGSSFNALGGDYGNAVLVRGRVLDGEVLKLPSFGEPRTLLRARVDVDGFTFNVFVTHLSAWGSLNRRMRAAEAACVAEQARAAARPFLLCGDLNAPPEASELVPLLRGDFLRLSGRAAEPTHALFGRRLDYIFGDPGFEVLRTEVVRRGPSDHWPVLAELGWTGASR